MKKIIFSVSAFLFSLASVIPKEAEAHVRYLVDDGDVEKYSGLDFEFLLSALTDPHNIALILWTIAGGIIAILISTQVKFFRDKFKKYCSMD